MEPCDTCVRARQRWADENDISREPGDERIILTRAGALEMCWSFGCDCSCHSAPNITRPETPIASDIEDAIVHSKARVRSLIARENATPLSRIPVDLLEVFDLCTVAGFADGVEYQKAAR